MVLDVLEGIPPFKPPPGDIPSGKRMHRSMESIHANRGGMDLREFLQHGLFIMPHVGCRILGVDGFAEFLDDCLAFRTDTNKLLRKLDGARCIVRFGAPDIARGGVEIGFQL